MDKTILRLNTAGLVSYDLVRQLVLDLAQEAGIPPDSVRVRGGHLSRRFVAGFKTNQTDDELAARRCAKVLQLMRLDGGRWRELAVTRPGDNTTERVYLSADRSRAQIAAEMATKDMATAAAELYPNVPLVGIKKEHMVAFHYEVLVTLAYDRRAGVCQPRWSENVAAKAGVDTARLGARFLELAGSRG